MLEANGSTPDVATPEQADSAPARPSGHKIGWDVRSLPVQVTLPVREADLHESDETQQSNESQTKPIEPAPIPVAVPVEAGQQAKKPSLFRVPAEKRLVLYAEFEPFWKRWLVLGAAIALAGLHFYLISSFWAPAHHGNNQNGYLVGAKNLALRYTTGFEPQSPLEFVGWMWVMADGASTAPGGGVHYPKYPIGVPLVDAIVYRIGLALHGEPTAVEWVFRVNPVSMSLALLGMFFIGRLVANSFAGLLAMILLGTSPLALILANNPNSHALALFFMIWGMYFMLRWWQSGRWWLGLLGGFMLGYAVSIRYTEGLLLAPLALAALLVITYRSTWELGRWRIVVWMLFAATAFVVTDAIREPVFSWQHALRARIGDKLLWWHSALVAVPALMTIRWGRISGIFSLQRLKECEWLRLLGCATIILVASFINVPRLNETTPATLHAARLLALLVAFGGAIWLMFAIDWRRPRTWLPATAPAVGWTIPVVGLVLFNWMTVGGLTGYDSTNESTGFTWNTFVSKWGNSADQLYNQGLYFVLPVGVLGILLAFRFSWRAAAVLLLWFLPGTLLYMAYYYGRGMPLIGYLRFFTSMLPPVVIGAVWLIHRAGVSVNVQRMGAVNPHDSPLPWWRRGSIAVPLGAGLFVAMPAAVNMNNQISSLERDHVLATNLSEIGRHVQESVPAEAAIFGHSQRLLNYLQFAGPDGARYYGSDYFFRDGFPVPAIGSMESDQPTPIQHVRRQFLKKAYTGLGQAERVAIQQKIMADAFAEGRRVFLVMDAGTLAAFRRMFIPLSKYETKVVQKWSDPARMSPTASRTLASVGADVGGRGSPQSWSIVEVNPKPTDPDAPATQPIAAAGAAKETEAQTASSDPPAEPRVLRSRRSTGSLPVRTTAGPSQPTTAPATQPTTQRTPTLQELYDRLKGR